MHAHSGGARLSDSAMYHSTPVSSATPALIASSLSPCVIHLEGLELLSASGASGVDGTLSGVAPDQQYNSMESAFLRSFSTWIRELQSVLRHAATDNRTSQHYIAVVGSVTKACKLSPTLHSLFSSTIDVTEIVTLSNRQIQTIASNHLTGSPSCESTDQITGSRVELDDKQRPQLIMQRITDSGCSYAAACVALQEAECIRNKQCEENTFEQWLQQCGLGEFLLGGTACPVDTPCIHRGGATDGQSAGGSASKYSTNIAPVHWSDIGGLDRLVGMHTKLNSSSYLS